MGKNPSCKDCTRNYELSRRAKRLPYLKTYCNNMYKSKSKEIKQQVSIYKKNNKGKVSALTAKRRAQNLKAMPKWLTKEQIAEINLIYKIASWLNAWKLEQFHVDHIIPLQGRNISGLHVPWNLQIITKSENLVKANTY